jgi:hypothetical protein
MKKDKLVNRRGIGVITLIYAAVGLAKIAAIAGVIPHILLPII